MKYISRLAWDGWNVQHIARHAVAPDEVEEICQNDYIPIAATKGRLGLVGRTRGGRILVVFMDPLEEDVGTYYPVTARPATRKEKEFYRTHKKEVIISEE